MIPIQQLFRAIMTGVALATPFNLWVAFLAVGQRSVVIQLRGGHRANALFLMGMYWGTGALAGIAWHLARPLAKHRAGSAFLGALVLLPFAAGIRVIDSGFQAWEFGEIVIVVLTACLLGGWGGLVVHYVLYE